MGLFDKKYCSICGEKIGFLGNRKLEDGNPLQKLLREALTLVFRPTQQHRGGDPRAACLP